MLILWIVLSYIIGAELLLVLINSNRDFSTKIFTSSGCNVLNSEARKSCCVEHDKAYGRGGWIISRFKADWNLFTCIWQKNKAIAVVIFLGVRLFGMFEFEYGKKRKLTYEDGTTDQ